MAARDLPHSDRPHPLDDSILSAGTPRLPPPSDWFRDPPADLRSHDERDFETKPAVAARDLEREIADLRLLQQLSTALIHDDGVEALYEEIVDAASKIMRSDFASMQLLCDRGGEPQLKLLASRGFSDQARSYWTWVRTDGGSACAQALRTTQRCTVHDTRDCEFIRGGDLPLYESIGIRAVQSTPLLSRGGTPIGMLSTHWRAPFTPSERDFRLFDLLARQAADLVERTLATEALQQRSAQFATLLNEAPVGVYLVDSEFRIRNVNPAAMPVFGKLRNLIGRDLGEVLSELLPLDDVREVMQIFRRTLESGEPYSTPERVEHRLDRGVTDYYEWQVHRIVLPDGFGVVSYVRDVSAQVLARAQIAAAAERHRKLVSVLTDIPWNADATGAFTEPQEAWMAYTGQEWDRHRGFGWIAAIHPEDRALVQQDWKQAFRLQLPFGSAGRLWNHARGEYRHFESRAVPLFHPDGILREWMGSCSDIHEAVMRQEVLLALHEERAILLEKAERARAEAEEANHAKDEFLAVLSHELRSPLNSMLGWIRILKRSEVQGDLVTRAVDTLERNIWTQAQVINDLLDVSRIASGKLQLERGPVDLADAVEQACDSMRPIAEARQLQLACSVEGEGFLVDGDPARLQQIVGNLLQNAVKFTPEGGRIGVAIRTEGDEVVVVVEDTGPGIDEALLPHVFDRFVQAGSSTTRKHGGLGLGLAIVSQLTRIHGGSVSVRNIGEGGGAEFELRFPRLEPAPTETVAEETPVAREVPVGGLDVLLVEDDEDCREVLAMMLESSGAHVRSAASASEALELYEQQAPDVLVSDIGMPGEDGYSLMRRIREREHDKGRHTLALAMTGFASQQDQESALRAGFDAHIGKPVDPDALLERVRELSGSQG